MQVLYRPSISLFSLVEKVKGAPTSNDSQRSSAERTKKRNPMTGEYMVDECSEFISYLNSHLLLVKLQPPRILFFSFSENPEAEGIVPRL